MLHLAVDVGGTFTDVCLFDDREGATRVAKVSSTKDPIHAVFDGIGEMDVALDEVSLCATETEGSAVSSSSGATALSSTGARESSCRRRRRVFGPCSNGASCHTGMMVQKMVEEKNMDEPRNVPFGELEWTDDAPGILAREAEVGGKRWATVEYGEGVLREEWCEEGHRGYVISGEIEYEFDDGREPLSASEGEAFRLPHAALGSGAHRGRNTAQKPTRLFLIDD